MTLIELIGADKCAVVSWEVWSSCSAHTINIPPKNISLRRKGEPLKALMATLGPLALKGQYNSAQRQRLGFVNTTYTLRPERATKGLDIFHLPPL